MSLILEREIRDWFIEGLAREAEYLMVVYDIPEQVCRPIFVYADQDVQDEVMRVVGDGYLKLRSVLTLADDMEVQIKTAASMNIVVSRVEN